MGKLKSPNMSAELRKLTPLRPIQQGATRWLSTMQMLERYLSIKDHLSKIPGLLELLLSPVEDNEVKELSKTMVPMKSVTLALQRDEMDMASVRLLFDELLASSCYQHRMFWNVSSARPDTRTMNCAKISFQWSSSSNLS